MVAKKPEDRPDSMSEVVAQLEGCVVEKSGAMPAKPAPDPRAVAETLKLHGKTVTAHPARSLSTAPPPRETRWEALERMKVARRQEQTRQKLQQAVKDADRDYRRRHGEGLLNRLIRILGSLANLGLKLAVLAALAWAAYFGFKVWQNSRLINRCQDEIVKTVNLSLTKSRLEAIPSIQFTNTSLLRPVPETLLFETPVFQKEIGGHLAAGTLKGQFEQGKRQLGIKIFNINGVCESDYVLPVDFGVRP